MGFQFLVKNAGCFRHADAWYVDGELLSGDLSKETPAIAMADMGELPVYIRNVSFVDPPIQNDRFFTLVIDKPDYDVEWLKGATMTEDLEEQEHEHEQESELQLAIHQ